jgi:hypothetical protein
VVPALWLFPVAFGARRALVLDGAVEGDAGAPVAVDGDHYVDLDRSYEPRRAAAT